MESDEDDESYVIKSREERHFVLPALMFFPVRKQGTRVRDRVSQIRRGSSSSGWGLVCHFSSLAERIESPLPSNLGRTQRTLNFNFTTVTKTRQNSAKMHGRCFITLLLFVFCFCICCTTESVTSLLKKSRVERKSKQFEWTGHADTPGRLC